MVADDLLSVFDHFSGLALNRLKLDAKFGDDPLCKVVILPDDYSPTIISNSNQ